MKNKPKTTYIYSSLAYFFSNSQIIDYELGQTSKLSLMSALDKLQQKIVTIDAVMALFSFLFEKDDSDKLLRLSMTNINKVIQLDALKITLNAIINFLNRLNTSQLMLSNLKSQMILKGLLNILYILIFTIWKNNTQQIINQFIQKYDLDNLFMKMVGMSLQVHYIPMKKLIMLYTLTLSNLFELNKSNDSIYDDQEIKKLPLENLITQNYLSKKQIKQTRNNTIQQFYKKHNVGDCPLAQYIVVGILRSLLTICNSHTHKIFQTQKGAGVDSFREWQISYNYILENYSQLESRLTKETLTKIQTYKQFNQDANSKIEQMFSQFYSHKIYTTSAITSFFMLLLIAFKKNLFIQYSYFLQLISDANGVLVFLKFLTDKFQNLDQLKSSKLIIEKEPILIKQQVMLTIYNVLSMLYAACNNYPQKIRNFLFEYNSYLIIKKIPRLFFTTVNSSQDQNMLPTRQDLDNRSLGILPQLTQLCYDLLKIQIPFFSKKAKQSSNNMRMIVDIYCRYPKIVKPIILTPLQKILLKNKVNQKQQKYVTSIQQLKNIHNQFNNIYYWSNDFLIDKLNLKDNLSKTNDNFPINVNVDLWLEDNIWRYYD